MQAGDDGAAALGPAANACKGVVEEAIYVGDVTRYRVGLGADGAVTIKVPNRLCCATACRRRGDRALLVAGRYAPLPRAARMKGTAGGGTQRYLLMLLPALLVLACSSPIPSSASSTAACTRAGYTLDFYTARSFVCPSYLQVLWGTFRVSALVTLLCLALGYPLAYVLASCRPRTARLLTIIVILPFFTSIIVRTYAFMVLLGRNGIVNQYLMALGLTDTPLPLLYNQAGVVLGMSYVLLPYMVLTVYSVMQGMDPGLVRAAHSLGASRLQAFRRVFLPLSLPASPAGHCSCSS